MSEKQTVVAVRLEKEPYTITEAQKKAAAERRGYGKPKGKKKENK